MKRSAKENSLHKKKNWSRYPWANDSQKSEFQEVLDAYLTEIEDDHPSPYSLHLPKQGVFWDDGYRDVLRVV